MPTTLTSSELLCAIVLCGVMGMVGQGVRAILGVRKAMARTTPADATVAWRTQFNAPYLLVSLMIGFIAGVIAGILTGISHYTAIASDNMKALLGLAAAGYAGTDFIESAFARLKPGGEEDNSGRG